jgi:pimeloyl-ACP methyl ester carboxylesterase
MNMNAWLTPFEDDLLKDIVPYVESHYPTLTSSNERALAGLSMGGRHAQLVGFKSLDLFASFGILSAGDPDSEKSTPEFLNDPETMARMAQTSSVGSRQLFGLLLSWLKLWSTRLSEFCFTSRKMLVNVSTAIEGLSDVSLVASTDTRGVIQMTIKIAMRALLNKSVIRNTRFARFIPSLTIA